MTKRWDGVTARRNDSSHVVRVPRRYAVNQPPSSLPALNGGLAFPKEDDTRARAFGHKVMYLRSSVVRALVRVWTLASIVGYERGEVRYSVGLTPHTLVKAREKAEV